MESAEKTARKALETLARDVRETLISAPRETIRPALDRVLTGEHGALVRLASIRQRSEALTFGRTLGQGGMGLVREAEQRSVGRPVAVKSLRSDTGDERAAMRLLQEGWVTGALEHPNVVPVHDMEVDDAGQPLIVFKRITGRDWSTLLADPDTVRADFGVRDPVEWHLKTLIQVCNAVEYAHSRGILHRDLKPENVRIGDYGEVYLLDWGIAVSLNDDRHGRLPLAADAHHLAGTPCYLAPEMVSGDGAQLSRQTDVYLLGAVLYEILYGRPPHRGETPLQMLVQAVSSQPDFPEGPPAELRALCRSALSKEPTGRPPRAEALAQSVREHLEHRASISLTRKAEERLAALESGAAEGEGEVHRLYGEARFGFRQALEVWPESPAAAGGQRRTLQWMAERELEMGRPEAARPLVEELEPPDGALAARVTAAVADQAARQAELERVHWQYDEAVGTRTRSFFALLCGLAWVGSPLLGIYPRPFPEALHSQVPLLLFALGFIYWARDSMTGTRINRRVAGFLIVALAQTMGLQALLWFQGVGWHAELQILIFSWATLGTAFTVGVERRLWPGAICMYLAALATVLWPTYHAATYALGNGLFVANAVYLWAPRDKLFHRPGRDE
jgi:eukaryotic-like serine/threonine-protein kinase